MQQQKQQQQQQQQQQQHSATTTTAAAAAALPHTGPSVLTLGYRRVAYEGDRGASRLFMLASPPPGVVDRR